MAKHPISSRRVFLATAGSAALSSCATEVQYLSARASASTIDGVPLCESIDGEGDRDSDARIERPPAPLLLRIREGGLADPRSAITWPARENAPDYRHLAHKAEPLWRFHLTAEVLTRLAHQGGFALPQDMLLFGLRGCKIVDPEEGMATGERIELEIIDPDHKHPHCVIGVWDRSSQTTPIAVFTGSTVPSGFYMFEQLHIPLTTIRFDRPNQDLRIQDEYFRRANLLPCGLYHYAVGDHGVGKQCADAIWAGRGAPPGGLVHKAFRATAGPKAPQGAGPDTPRKDLVLRAITKLEYNIDQVWDYCEPFDNLHPARTNQLLRWNAPPELNIQDASFSSAGCQVIEGDASYNTHRGAWAAFRRRAQRDADKKHFSYMLATGDEAFHLSRSPRARGVEPSLRIGSRGEAVGRLLRELYRRDAGSVFHAHHARDLLMRVRTLKAPVVRLSDLDRVIAELGRAA